MLSTAIELQCIDRGAHLVHWSFGGFCVAGPHRTPDQVYLRTSVTVVPLSACVCPPGGAGCGGAAVTGDVGQECRP